MKQTQRELILEQLIQNGYVSRNWALQNYITRLANYIFNFKEEGWEFKSDYYLYEYGKDYRYVVTYAPKRYETREQLKLI